MYPPLSLGDANLTSPSEAPVPLLGHVPTPARHRGNHSSDFFRSFSGFSLEFHHMCLCLNSSWPVFLSQKLVMGWGAFERLRQLALETEALRFYTFRVGFDISANQGLGQARAAWEQRSWIHGGRRLTKRRGNMGQTPKKNQTRHRGERERERNPPKLQLLRMLVICFWEIFLTLSIKFLFTWTSLSPFRFLFFF